MEETANQQVYNDLQFISHEELETLDALHLLKSKKVQPHMHGYLIEQKTLSFIRSNLIMIILYINNCFCPKEYESFSTNN